MDKIFGFDLVCVWGQFFEESELTFIIRSMCKKSRGLVVENKIFTHKILPHILKKGKKQTKQR